MWGKLCTASRLCQTELVYVLSCATALDFNAHSDEIRFLLIFQVNDYDGLVPDVQYWLVTEYHPLGSLYDYLHTNTVGWPELLRIAISVARGLTHLHAETTLTNGMDSVMGHPKLSVAHRDLNSRNVLLKQDMSACIADFGLAIRFDPGQFPSVAHPQVSLTCGN